LELFQDFSVPFKGPRLYQRRPLDRSGTFLLSFLVSFLKQLYNGDEFLEFIHHLHASLLGLFIREFTETTKIPNLKDPVSYPVLYIIKNMKKALLYTNFFYVVWPEIALRLLEIQEFDSSWASEEIMDLLVRIIRRPECYNALLPSEKLQILSHFIQSSYELDILHDEVGKIGTRHQELQKEKTALQEDIKSDEIHLVELKSQLSNQETLVKKKESAFEEYKETAPNGADTTMSKLRSDTNKKQKEIDDAKRERQRIEYSIEKLEIQVDKKKAQYKKVSKEMLSIMHTSQYIGSESKGNSYWLFIFDAGRVYAHSALEDKWGFYETQAEIEELLKALDTRGIMEQKLWEKIKWFLASDLISLPQTKKDEQIKKNEEKGAGENEKTQK
jgi:hypothetical protein